MFDNTESYQSSLSSNTYTFSNIGNIITLMAQNKANGLKTDPNWVANHPDWNKVVLVPINANITYDSYNNPSISAVTNQMGLTSTKLMGGSDNPIEVKVIYAKFKEQ